MKRLPIVFFNDQTVIYADDPIVFIDTTLP